MITTALNAVHRESFDRYLREGTRIKVSTHKGYQIGTVSEVGDYYFALVDEEDGSELLVLFAHIFTYQPLY